jgi:L-arabinose isomerase
MWIRGLSVLSKPFPHFHTRLNRDIPWDTIDMDFMNLNQSALGNRIFVNAADESRIREFIEEYKAYYNVSKAVEVS